MIGLCLWLSRPRLRYKENALKLRTALSRLIDNPYGSYLIVEDPEFGKHLQVSGSINEPIVFDLPCNTLTLDEYDRACELFNALGHNGPETFEISTPFSNVPADTQSSFLMTFSRSNLGTLEQLALTVFAHVYQTDQRISLNIIEQ